jgi:hypothetical protein
MVSTNADNLNGWENVDFNINLDHSDESYSGETQSSNNVTDSSIKSKNKPCRHLIKINDDSNNQHGICSICSESIKMSSGSDANLRTI